MNLQEKQPHILYIEDDSRSLRVLKMLLVNRMKLTNVTFFESSDEFEERVAALTPVPDVVFLDIQVRPLNGFQMLNVLRALPSYADVPIVALTASVMNDEVESLMHAGFDGCIAKPINQEAFPDLLVSILQGESIWRIVG